MCGDPPLRRPHPPLNNPQRINYTRNAWQPGRFTHTCHTQYIYSTHATSSSRVLVASHRAPPRATAKRGMGCETRVRARARRKWCSSKTRRDAKNFSMLIKCKPQIPGASCDGGDVRSWVLCVWMCFSNATNGMFCESARAHVSTRGYCV